MAFLKAISFGRSKHQKLPEKWDASIKQPVTEGIPFYVKYLGSTLVDEPSNEAVTADAIKTIIALAKASGKKPQRVELVVKPTGIIIRQSVATSNKDNQTTSQKMNGNTNLSDDSFRELLNVSIYQISYCSADAHFDRVVAFIATNKNETMECHAFLTAKRKIAQAAALTISQAFTIAYERWKAIKAEKKRKLASMSSGITSTNGSADEPPLIDLATEVSPSSTSDQDLAWLEVDDGFSKLATRRTSKSAAMNNNSGLTQPTGDGQFLVKSPMSLAIRDGQQTQTSTTNTNPFSGSNFSELSAFVAKEVSSPKANKDQENFFFDDNLDDYFR